MSISEYIVRFINLPPPVEGVTIPNADGTFNIYINATLSVEVQRKKLDHEIHHIECDDFYDDISPVGLIERLAKDGTEPI